MIEITDSLPPGSEAYNAVIHDIWQLKLLDVIAVVLKMDFTAVPPDSWMSASQLISLATTCVSSDQGKMEFQRDLNNGETLMNLLCESYLECIRNCCNRYCSLMNDNATPASGTEKYYCLRALKAMFSDVALTLENFNGLAYSILRSGNFAQVLMSQNEDCCLQAVCLLETIFNQPSALPTDLDVIDFVEELLFKMATTSDRDFCQQCLASLKSIINVYSRYATVINSRFKGVREMISDNWNSQLKLPEDEIAGFFRLLDRHDPTKLARSANKEVAAALAIQCFVRGCLARKKMRLANAAFGKLQKKWRQRKLEEAKQKYLQEQQDNAKFKMLLDKKQRVRKSRQMLLKQMLATPPEQFPSFLHTIEQSAAARIQAAWRGHIVRGKYQNLSQNERRENAARQIQRSYKRYRHRKGHAGESTIRRKAYELPELTPEGRQEIEREIQHRIIDFKTRNPGVNWTHGRLELLHERCQDQLADYYKTILDNRRNLYESKIAMARIDVDLMTLRETCPAIDSATDADISRLACPTKWIQQKATVEHKRALELASGPWWASFGIETEREGREYRRLISDEQFKPIDTLLLQRTQEQDL